MSYNEHIIKRMNYINHNQNMGKYKTKHCLYHIQFSAIVRIARKYILNRKFGIRCHLMECSTLEATYVFYHSSTGVLFHCIFVLA